MSALHHKHNRKDMAVGVAELCKVYTRELQAEPCHTKVIAMCVGCYATLQWGSCESGLGELRRPQKQIVLNKPEE